MNAPSPSPVLRADALACVRGDRQIFSGVSFNLPAGTLLHVLGPNGSGKTSLLRIVCGLLGPAAGEVSWDGRPIRALGDNYHAAFAYIGHLNGIKDELDAAENLTLTARLAELPANADAVSDALQGYGLAECRHLPCKLLSQGQKRRVALARLQLSGMRPLWILDEPFTALDATGIGHTRSLIEAHLAGGGLVLLTTHQEIAVAAPSMQRLELHS